MFFITPFFTFALIFKSDLNDEEFKAKYGSFFLEFKYTEGVKMSMFYPIFFLRRLAYVLAQIYLNNYPALQVTLNIFFTMVQLGYCLILRPFIEKSLFLSEVCGELCTLIVIVSTSVFIEQRSGIYIGIIENVVIYSLLGTFVLQMCVCMYCFFSSACELFRKVYKNRTAQIIRNQIYID